MRYPKIELDNGFVFYQDHFTGPSFERIRYNNDVYCPLCNQKIKNNEDTYLAIANNLFPNCFIHKECVKKDAYYLLEEFQLEHVTQTIMFDYSQYKIFKERWKAWQ